MGCPGEEFILVINASDVQTDKQVARTVMRRVSGGTFFTVSKGQGFPV